MAQFAINTKGGLESTMVTEPPKPASPDKETRRIGAGVDEEEIDRRRLCVKGSGSTYVIGSKIGDAWELAKGAIEADQIGPETPLIEPDGSSAMAFFEGLPRRATDAELFLTLARRCNVFNNFPASALGGHWDEDAIRDAVLKAHPDISRDEFYLSVIAPEPWVDSAHEHVFGTVGDMLGAMERVAAFARAYEAFLEKAFDIWRRGREALAYVL